MKKQLYLAIKNRLKNIPGADGQPLFKHFDLWNQQVEFMEQETPFLTPAVFVEFLPMKWRTLGNRVQDADLITRLHIVTEWHALTADNVPAEEQELALVYLDSEAMKKDKLDQEAISDIPEQIRHNVNRIFPKYSQISKVEVVLAPFEKTPKMSIKRYLYK